ncbi:hypothetical protein CHK_2650 [Christensenella hongkongensis]|uniref:Uncharacterized protein n=1 Tax=Christensenella hongkongensis TaxID=270498 RepID=A0A0M2NHD9_9FIRM|nr:hypothetical protein CHK_2650 [Christensenella hongkongensis]
MDCREPPHFCGGYSGVMQRKINNSNKQVKGAKEWKDV